MHACENKHLLQQRFYEFTYKQEADVMTRITAMEGLPTQLRDLGAAVDNHQIIKKSYMHSTTKFPACCFSMGQCP